MNVFKSASMNEETARESISFPSHSSSTVKDRKLEPEIMISKVPDSLHRVEVERHRAFGCSVIKNMDGKDDTDSASENVKGIKEYIL